MIGIVDYGMGNLGSIRNMLKRIGIQSELISRPEQVLAAHKLILPGVGAFDAGMRNLEDSQLISPLNEAVLGARRVPVLGICLGMQLMTRSSEEGSLPGLGWMDARAVKFEPTPDALKVPHMGWSDVLTLRDEPLVRRLPPEPRFYFVHSYYVRCSAAEDALLTTRYGIEFHSAFARGNIWGVQFHPEKSHKFGMQLLKNFAEAC